MPRTKVKLEPEQNVYDLLDKLDRQVKEVEEFCVSRAAVARTVTVNLGPDRDLKFWDEDLGIYEKGSFKVWNELELDDLLQFAKYLQKFIEQVLLAENSYMVKLKELVDDLDKKVLDRLPKDE